MRKKLFSGIKMVVVKVGSGVLTSSRSCQLERVRIRSIVSGIAGLSAKHIRVVLVSSGAIAGGMGLLALKKRPKDLAMQQACAACGQSLLMSLYAEEFRRFHLSTAQILLTQEDLKNRKRYLNAKNTILRLLEHRVIPIVNENDTVSTEEIKFGDNDRLSAFVANLVKAELLLMLSDVDGFYKGERKEDGCKFKEVISVVERVTSEIERFAKKSGKEISTGGMVSKLDAVKIAAASGVTVVIANGRRRGIIEDVLSGKEVGTVFRAREDRLGARKHWIAFTTKPKGDILVDNGAREALIEKKKSLLASGVLGIEGRFAAGDTIAIKYGKQEFGRGLTSYSSEEIERIKGLKSSQIASVLGDIYYDEVVHRDNMVIS